MRYLTLMAKLATVMVGAVLVVAVGAPAAFADHGSAWSMRQTGAVLNGGSPSTGAVPWVIAAILGAALVWAAVRLVLTARSGRGDGPDGPKMPADGEGKPVIRVFAPKVVRKEPVSAGRFQVLSS
jgi:hypothetical protein